MYDAQVDEATIMEQTGHRSTDSVRAYKQTSEKLRELPSDVLKRYEIMAKVEKSSDSSVFVAGDENKPAAPDDMRKHSESLALELQVHVYGSNKLLCPVHCGSCS